MLITNKQYGFQFDVIDDAVEIDASGDMRNPIRTSYCFEYQSEKHDSFLIAGLTVEGNGEPSHIQLTTIVNDFLATLKKKREKLLNYRIMSTESVREVHIVEFTKPSNKANITTMYAMLTVNDALLIVRTGYYTERLYDNQPIEYQKEIELASFYRIVNSLRRI